MPKVGEEIQLGAGRRFRVLDVMHWELEELEKALNEGDVRLAKRYVSKLRESNCSVLSVIKLFNGPVRRTSRRSSGCYRSRPRNRGGCAGHPGRRTHRLGDREDALHACFRV